MTSPEQMLREFHASKAIHGGLMPEKPTADIPPWVQMLRMDLLDEEVSELHEAVEKGDIAKIADGIADIAYVVVGTAVAYGIPFDAVFAEVHRSNMTKINTPAEAKLVKGPGYEPPRIAEVLASLDRDDGCLTHVPMVCTTCRKPVRQVPGIWAATVWAHADDGDARDCPDRGAHLTGTPVMAMVEAGNENVPRKEAGQ